MPPVHLLAANQINADTAGMTSGAAVGAEHAAIQMPPGATVGEALDGEGFGGIFGSGMVGAFHPEHIAQVILTPLQKATDSVAGPHGGMKPARGSPVQPGPAGPSAVVKMMESVRSRFRP